MYRMIMVPLDGSRFAESALPVALSVSRRTGAPLHLVTVQEPIPPFAYDEWENAAEDWSREYLSNAVDRVRPLAGGDVTATMLTGEVVEVVETVARPAGTPALQLRGRLVDRHGELQAELTARNPYQFYGTSWDGAAWSNVTVA